MPAEGPPMAWVISLVGVWVLVSPFVFGITGIYQISLVASGVVVAALAAYRAWQPDEKVPLPALPLAVIVVGLWSILSTFVFGNGFSDTHGITIIVAGIVFVAGPAMMINQMINEQHAASA